jgi:RNA polymerase sigma factor (sigma-70 family)
VDGQDEAEDLVDNRPDDMEMLAVREGDVGKMGTLFERHHRMLFNFFLRLTGSRAISEDLVQDVFFRMLKYRHTYQPENNFMAWMYRVARNAHLDHARKLKLELVPDTDEQPWEPASHDPSPHQKLEQEQEVALLRRALDRLPVEKREVLVLSRFQNLKYDEIAEILGCEVGAVKVRVYRATKELSEIYFELAGEKAS